MRSLQRVLGPEAARRAYDDACARLGWSPEVDDLAPDDLRTLARDLIDNGHGLVRVVGRTLLIRLQTYRQLDQLDLDPRDAREDQPAAAAIGEAP